MEIFNIKNLTFTYPLKETPALNSINFNVSQGEFITICGKSGCGKSTLLRHLKPQLTPHGKFSGDIMFKGRSVNNLNLRDAAREIGYVMQNPDNQIVTDKVWHELAFGLESLGFDNNIIRLRVAEMASFFGIQSWFYKSVNELSGGQKQLLNLAAIMAMQPEALVLDEPTSQLDPIAAVDFLETIKKINREIGTTIIMSEHRLEDVFTMSDRILVMDKGEIIVNDAPQAAGIKLKQMGHEMFFAMPSPMRIYAEIENDNNAPLTVKDGRNWITDKFKNINITEETDIIHESKEDVLIKLKNIWFRYEKNSADIIKDLSFEVKKGEFFCIVGGNGTGKTTALSLVSGINKPYRGKIDINKKYKCKIGVLPQNPQALFLKNTVELDLLEITPDKDKVHEMAEFMGIADLLGMHPYDLSGGEQQKSALAKILLLEPDILLLDEPTKGLDGFFKRKLAEILKSLINQGTSIIMVSHDIEFCAKYADKCALFFDGSIITTGTPKKFFSGNSFYTTAANRMCRNIFKNAVTCEEVINLCKINL